jgi:hypothetical protein
MFITEIVTAGVMATDSFFVRAGATFDGTNFVQTSIDLGAFVDALGKSVMRIHNISVQWAGTNVQLTPAANTDYAAMFQLTTQTQTAIVAATDKSVISTGKLSCAGGANSEIVMLNDSVDVAPQEWRNGYLVGVETIYLGVDQNADFGLDACNVVLECTVEKLSEKAAMALALSQQ